jgi:hypothetical protein
MSNSLIITHSTWEVSNEGECVDSDELSMLFLEPIPNDGMIAGPDQILFYQFETLFGRNRTVVVSVPGKN